jgi:hypothetical protein
LRKRMLSAVQAGLLRIVRDGGLADFVWLHYEIRGLLRGSRRSPDPQQNALARGDYSDEQLIALCRASAERVASWRTAGTTTNDLGWASALTGNETADLIRAAFETATDRNFLRREMPPLIDILAEHGRPGIASELRIMLRRG